MLELIQTEVLKLRRKKLLWLMLPAALVMPFFAWLYFRYFGEKVIDAVLFYKWSAFSGTLFIILPFVLGILCTMLMHDENRYDMLKQLWIVPVSKMGYFFSKFVIVLAYAVGFMLLDALASILFSVLSGYVAFEWESIRFLVEKCLEIAILTALAILPILAAAASQKGYIFPACLTLVYVLAGFLVTPVSAYVHPISSVLVIIARHGDIPEALSQAIDVPAALLCISVWAAASVVLAQFTLGQRK